MNNKLALIGIVGILVLSVGGFIVLKKQKAQIDTIPNIVSNETTKGVPIAEEPTSAPADAKKDTTTLVTKIAQITLTVSTPSNNSTVTSPKISVKGKTLARAEVFANEAEGIADAYGNFSLSVNVDEGVNDIIITAVDSEGNVAETVVTVTYDAGE